MQTRSRLALVGWMAAAAAMQNCSGQGDEHDVGGVEGALDALTLPEGALEQVLGPKSSQVYVVRLAEDPAITYSGGIPGLRATKPARGAKLDPGDAAVRRYVDHLVANHDGVLAAVGAAGAKVYSYTYSFDGFAAVLTPSQAAAVAAQPGVVSVQPDALRFPTTDNTPAFLGLSGEGGAWEQLGGQSTAGEDVIVGVIDTGIWPEHPSFSDQLDQADRPGSSGKKTRAYGPVPASWHGTCQSGEQFSQDDCNRKLIGARYFLDGFTHQGVIRDDYLSARDADGHGSHTASTAAGNANVRASIGGNDLGLVSGMAPRARIAAYKVCWNGEGCAVSDLAAGIDAAVADGVDVINYSIGGGPAMLTADELAFLFASDAGVFVAASAGNEGPGPGTVGSPAVVPWVTTVGASTHDRTFLGAVTLGDGTELVGASLTSGTDELAIVDAADAAGDDLCFPGELDPAVVAGKIVLCQRGIIARVDKSLAVWMAGGAGMVLYDEADAMTQATDNHYVPTVHLDHGEGLIVKAYIADLGADATAQIAAGVATKIPAPLMASFSSRGPNAVAADIVKPDVTAPGVDVLAANTPTPMGGVPGHLFHAISGTSMSSPHTAGIGALLTDAHPDWTPAMMKSALVTTGSQDVLQHDGLTPADPFDMGGGHIVPTSALDPGLVYDVGIVDHIRFLCAASPQSVGTELCNALGGALDPSDLNLPSIGVAELAGRQTVTRTVTNVGPAGTYTVAVEAPAGITVAVTPDTLTLDEGASAAYQVELTATTDAQLDSFQFGSLTWSDGDHAVRSPIAVRAVRLSAPQEVSGSGTDGHLEYPVVFGFDSSAFTALPAGLFPAATEAGNVVDDPANDINVALTTGVGITMHAVVVEPGTLAARFSLFDEYTDGTDDLDLYIFGPDAAGFPYVGGSGSGTSAERVDLIDVGGLPPGLYLAVVHGWQTDGADANYTLFSWTLPGLPADPANLSVTAPSVAVLGETATTGIDWFGLAPNTKYMGAVGYLDGGALFAGTIVSIATD